MKWALFIDAGNFDILNYYKILSKRRCLLLFFLSPNFIEQSHIYLLLNRERQELYIGETRKTLSQRYPEGQEHHSFDDWTEYSIIQLPPETSDHTRLLIERILIALGAKLFQNNLSLETL